MNGPAVVSVFRWHTNEGCVVPRAPPVAIPKRWLMKLATALQMLRISAAFIRTNSVSVARFISREYLEEAIYQHIQFYIQTIIPELQNHFAHTV
jgi:hypothetical protein